MSFLGQTQRGSAAPPFDSTNSKRLSVVLMRGDSNEVGVGNVLMPVSIVRKVNESEGLAFVKYFEITTLNESIDIVLNCICPR